MSVWEGLVGQDGPVGLLERDIASGRVAHAYLFAGAAGHVPSAAAAAFAAALVCPEHGCGSCAVCTRVLRHAHPDVELVEPAGMQLLVDQVRDVLRAVWRVPVSARRRVVVVEGADRMNPNAQNAFLRALEEPPTSATIVLVAPDAETLLPTVRSRCREVVFQGVPEAQTARLLEEQGIAPDEARRWARIGGSLERTTALARDPEARARRDGVVERVLRPVRDPADALESAAWLAGETKAIRDRIAEARKAREAEDEDWHRETKRASEDRLRREQRRAEQDALDAALDDVISVLRDLLVVAADPEGRLVNVEQREALVRRVAGLGDEPVGRVLACLGEIERVRRRLRVNANVLLALERAFLAIARHLG